MNKRLLVITRHRLSENNGGSNGSKGFIHCFAALFDNCSLIYPDFKEDPAAFIPAKYKLYPCHDGRPDIQKGLDMYRGVVSSLSAFTKAHLATHRYDVIVIDHSFIASSLIKAVKQTGAKVITIHHNVERDYLNDNKHQFGLSYRLPYLFFGKKAERDCLLASDVNLTVTQRDAATFRSWYADRDLHVYEWGNFEYRPIEEKSFPVSNDGQTFVITGSLCFEQSLAPIMEFVTRYWPLVKETYPAARLIVAGRNPSARLVASCHQQSGITVIANPTEMTTIVAQGNYYVCPINKGSGRKLRVIDGLRQGLPVLCHQVSVSGYEKLLACNCLYAYHDEASFSHSLNQMISAQVSPATVYQAYRQNFSLETGIQRLRTVLEKESIL